MEKTGWVVVVQEPLKAARQAYENWLQLNNLEPPPDKVRIDTIRALPHDLQRYLIDVKWLAEVLGAPPS